MRSTPLGRWPALGAAFLAVLVAASACGTSPSSPPRRSTAPTTASTVGPATTVIDGRTVRIPTERGDRPIAQAVDAGNQALIRADGFWPEQLMATADKPIVWTNLTTETVVLTFLNAYPPTPRTSGPIAPGSTFSWTPHTLIGLVIRSSTGFEEQLTVAPFLK